MDLGLYVSHSSLVQLMTNRINESYAMRYKLIIATKCEDESAHEYMETHVEDFVVCARMLSEVQILDAKHSARAFLDRNKHLKSEIKFSLAARVFGSDNVIEIVSWDGFVRFVVKQCEGKVVTPLSVKLTDTTIFEILNKMVGDKVLYDLRDSINKKLADIRKEASDLEVLPTAVDKFVEDTRQNYVKKLFEFFQQNMSMDILRDEDVLDALNQVRVKDVLDL